VDLAAARTGKGNGAVKGCELSALARLSRVGLAEVTLSFETQFYHCKENNVRTAVGSSQPRLGTGWSIRKRNSTKLITRRLKVRSYFYIIYAVKNEAAVF
jgi:hypothetical protein